MHYNVSKSYCFQVLLHLLISSIVIKTVYVENSKVKDWDTFFSKWKSVKWLYSDSFNAVLFFLKCFIFFYSKYEISRLLSPRCNIIENQSVVLCLCSLFLQSHIQLWILVFQLPNILKQQKNLKKNEFLFCYLLCLQLPIRNLRLHSLHNSFKKQNLSNLMHQICQINSHLILVLHSTGLLRGDIEVQRKDLLRLYRTKLDRNVTKKRWVIEEIKMREISYSTTCVFSAKARRGCAANEIKTFSRRLLVAILLNNTNSAFYCSIPLQNQLL